MGPDGLFYKDTRFLSEFTVRLGGAEPLQLGTVLLDDNGAMVVDLTNADLHTAKGRVWLQRESVHLSRFKFLNDSSSFERIRLRSYGPIGRTISVDIAFDADFADLFEVRGTMRAERGTKSVKRISGGELEFRYLGLDQVTRRTVLRFGSRPRATRRRNCAMGRRPRRGTRAVDHDPGVLPDRRRPGGSGTIAQAFRTTHKVRREMALQRAISTQQTPIRCGHRPRLVRSRHADDRDRHGGFPTPGCVYSTIFGRDGISPRCCFCGARLFRERACC